MSNQRWLKGPEFLWKIESEWPSRFLFKVDTDDPEVKAASNAALVNESRSVIDSLLIKYSSWNRLRRIMAWLLVFKHRFLQLNKRDGVKVEDELGPVIHLTPDMLEAAEVALVKYVQEKVFSDELKCLSEVNGRNQGVAKSSAVYKLSPMLLLLLHLYLPRVCPNS